MNTAAVIANICIIGLEIIGLSKSISGRGLKIFAFYTQVSNIITLISSILFLVTGGQTAPVRYLSTCMLVMTFLITLCVLVPMGGGFRNLMLSGNGLYHHTLCPIISVLSYIFWEPHGGSILLPMIVTTVYGLILLFLNGLRLFDGPYPFFRVHNQSKAATVLWTAALICLIGVISAVIKIIAP